MSQSRQRRTRKAVEWPTCAVAFMIYTGFTTLTWYHAILPWWIVAVTGAFLGAWHTSLQHEIVHGHPTRWRWVNHLLARPSLTLWLPFDLYRRSHLAHHVDSRLTDPLEDPESFYITPRTWATMGRMRRSMLWMHNTLAGRLLLGPLRIISATLKSEAKALARGEGRHVRDWAAHLPAVTVLGVWAFGIAGMPIWLYVLAFTYGGTSLMLLRSFLEHQATENIAERTVVVDAEWPFRLLYLNNNLHAVHHHRPRLPWYHLPEQYRRKRHDYLSANGAYHYTGYLAIILRHLFVAKEPPVHPRQAGPQLTPPRGEHSHLPKRAGAFKSAA